MDSNNLDQSFDQPKADEHLIEQGHSSNLYQWTKVVYAISTLLKAAAWPLIALLFIIKFGSPINGIIENYSKGIEQTLVNGGKSKIAIGNATFEVEIEKGVEAGVNLMLAKQSKSSVEDSTGTKQIQSSLYKPKLQEIQSIAQTVKNAAFSSSGLKNNETSILWVDDQPANNMYLRKSLDALGFHVIESTSTDDAVTKLHDNKYKVVITDMKRGDNTKAGYDLLDKIRNQWQIPVIIFSASSNAQFEKAAKEKGAFAETNNPETLVNLVKAASEGKQFPDINFNK